MTEMADDSDRNAVVATATAAADGDASPPRKRRVSSSALAAIGQKGGRNCSSKYGREFYRRIGQLGGAARVDQIGRQGFSEIGRKGGQHPKQKGPRKRPPQAIPVSSSELASELPSGIQ